MSSRVCRPLKRAKSTVGVPLMRETLSPLEAMALMLINWTEKEVTLAMGASVPTTKAGPVTLPVAVVPSMELPQPAASSEAVARERRYRGSFPAQRDDKKDIDDIGGTSLS